MFVNALSRKDEQTFKSISSKTEPQIIENVLPNFFFLLFDVDSAAARLYHEFRPTLTEIILRIRRGQYKHGGVWQHWFWSRVIIFILLFLFFG